MPAAPSTTATSLLLGGARLPRLFQLQSLRAPAKPPFRRAAASTPSAAPLPRCRASASPRPLGPASALALPVSVTAAPAPQVEEDGWVGGAAAAVRRGALAAACGALAAAWCRRAMAVGAAAAAGAGAGAGPAAPGAVEAAAGIGGMALREAWPKVLQVLQLLREQGLVLAALLGLSAFFSMAETSITTLWPWKCWFLKCFILSTGALIMSTLIPTYWIQTYGNVAPIGAGIFVYIQMISVIRYITRLYYKWCHTNYEQHYVEVLFVSFLAYSASTVGGIFMIIWYAHSRLNTVLISTTLLLVYVMPFIALKSEGKGRSMEPGLLGVYILFLCWSAIRSEPETSSYQKVKAKTVIHRCSSFFNRNRLQMSTIWEHGRIGR